ncbi:MAG: HYC_CC_PP family protein [Bacteroidia bacterium]
MVATYVTITVGIPVYLHYCGGELEDISYVIKKVSCAGEEEDAKMDCCMDQDLVLRNNPDFTASQPLHIEAAHYCTLLFYSNASFYCDPTSPVININTFLRRQPPKLYNDVLSFTSVLRI